MAPFGWKKPNPRSVKTTFGKGDPGNRFFSAGNRLRPEGCETGAKPGVSGCISNLSDSDGGEFNLTRPRGGVGGRLRLIGYESLQGQP